MKKKMGPREQANALSIGTLSTGCVNAIKTYTTLKKLLYSHATRDIGATKQSHDVSGWVKCKNGTSRCRRTASLRNQEVLLETGVAGYADPTYGVGGIWRYDIPLST